MPYDDVPKGEGRVLRDLHIALYRDSEGGLVALTSVCPHRGCDVGWNDEDRVWACPCHGSLFGPSGEVIHGPATRPLDRVEIPE